jgi:hypothetical protein
MNYYINKYPRLLQLTPLCNHLRNWDSIGGIVTKLQAGYLQELWFDSQQGQAKYLSSTVSRPALGSTQFPNQWISQVKQTNSKADHSSPSCAEVRNEGTYISTPHMLSWCDQR